MILSYIIFFINSHLSFHLNASFCYGYFLYPTLIFIDRLGGQSDLISHKFSFIFGDWKRTKFISYEYQI